MGKMFRLEQGFLTDEGVLVSPTVYERPVMLVYTGEFDSMDGPVTIDENKINLLVSNHNSMFAKIKRLATGDVPMKDCPPLQLDHSTSATHTVGRLVGPLSSGQMDIDGSIRLALFGTVRFLGAENVEKAKDGRWTHVSIGADLEDGIINELSVTPFPAAPRASLLSKEKVLSEVKEEKEKGEPQMHEKLKKHLMDKKKLSEEDAEKMSKECLAHSMKKLGLDDEKMGKHMADADDKEMSRMSDEHDEHLKHLAEPEKKEEEKEKDDKDDKDAKMAAKSDFVKLALGIRSGNNTIHLELRKSTVASRLSKLRSEGKITPAEIKKLDIVKMSSLTDGEMQAALSTFDARESFALNSMTGTSKAEGIDKVAKKYRMARIELESRLNMPSKREEAKKRLAQMSEDEKKEMAAAGGSEKEEPTKGMLTKLTYDEMCAMMDDKKRHEELKRHLAHMMDHHGVEMPEHSDAHMSSLAKKQSELQNSLEQLIALASPALGIKPEEIK